MLINKVITTMAMMVVNSMIQMAIEAVIGEIVNIVVTMDPKAMIKELTKKSVRIICSDHYNHTS